MLASPTQWILLFAATQRLLAIHSNTGQFVLDVLVCGLPCVNPTRE